MQKANQLLIRLNSGAFRRVRIKQVKNYRTKIVPVIFLTGTELFFLGYRAHYQKGDGIRLTETFAIFVHNFHQQFMFASIWFN